MYSIISYNVVRVEIVRIHPAAIDPGTRSRHHNIAYTTDWQYCDIGKCRILPRCRLVWSCVCAHSPLSLMARTNDLRWINWIRLLRTTHAARLNIRIFKNNNNICNKKWCNYAFILWVLLWAHVSMRLRHEKKIKRCARHFAALLYMRTIFTLTIYLGRSSEAKLN